MKFEILSIFLAFVATMYSFWFYLQAHKAGRDVNPKKIENTNLIYYLKHARLGFYAMTWGGTNLVMER